MSWFARRTLDLVSKLTDFYYTRKYGALAQQLGRPRISPDHRRGFIIIQIDGLSHDHLTQAIDAGYMPHLAHLLDEGLLSLTDWRCGLPSTTPAVQAGIMFGNRFDIPGFRWYEKEHRQGISCKRPDQMQLIRARISQGQRGILEGGSCYVSLFDGDADLALFTLSTLNSQRFFESVRGMGLLFLFLLSPFRVLRMIGIIVVNYLTGLGRRLIALVRPSILNPFDVISPLLHAISAALLTEAQTFGVLLDIYRCAPAIYANYNSYDEAAHNMGPDHRAAFRVLRGVDRRIQQIDHMRARHGRREYDLYILSDHGNSPSRPFQWHMGVPLDQYITTHIGDEIPLNHTTDTPPPSDMHSQDKKRYLLQELESLEQSASPQLKRILTAIRTHATHQMPMDHILTYDPEQQQDVITAASGPLAHIYFNTTSRPLDLIEVTLLYPRLVDALLATPGIGVISGRSGEQTILLGQNGGVMIAGMEHVLVTPPHPLEPLGEVEYGTRQLHRLAHFPHAGDLIVLGAAESNGTIVGFEEQVATHGGLGGAQMRPFIAWPPERPLTSEFLHDAQDLYTYFAQLYLGDEK